MPEYAGRVLILGLRAGRDASRSFVTGCFETHLTHDLRGLSDAELQVGHISKFRFAKLR